MGRVTLQNLAKQFGDVVVIPDASLDIPHGEFVAFVGPSGCGKSTLLRLIAGLEDASGGKILIDGVDMAHTPPARRGLAMVFQSYALYPHMSVRGNIAFGLRMARMPPDQIAARVEGAAKMLNLTDYLERKPRHLSGGQRQRVAIGRAIVREPKCFLFDEPLSNLDAALRVQMRLELMQLHQSLDATMIYVTHDQIEAMTMADRIVVLNHGRIEQQGAPLELYHRPQSLFVAGFIGSPRMNFITGAAAAKCGATTLGIRPEHILLEPLAAAATATAMPQSPPIWPEGIAGKIALVEHSGADSYLHVDSEMGRLVVRCDGDYQGGVGRPVSLWPHSAKLHKFDQHGMSMNHATQG
ncbi:MAG: ABC transporter ATP-binding protein [Candidatus Symbiobacter sp.]|nr:ABC transporter ATP-binding protein [Candidatus Symbiobacter sp.]